MFVRPQSLEAMVGYFLICLYPGGKCCAGDAVSLYLHLQAGGTGPRRRGLPRWVTLVV